MGHEYHVNGLTVSSLKQHPLKPTETAPAQALTSANVRPFLKWAGGKTALIAQFRPHFPVHCSTYHEPFLGGGAVFLHLKPESSWLSDINSRLIDCYTAIRDNVGVVIEGLTQIRATHCAEQYYATRDRLNFDPGLDRNDRAVLQIYLNKTCFNGLYRENKKGQFNVPVGRYNNPNIFSQKNLLAVSRRLSNAQIESVPFESVLDRVRAGDFVYFDPPYAPISRTSNFTNYTKHGFGDAHQAQLANVCRELDRRGVRFLLSNSNASLIRDLYRGFHVHSVQAKRRINAKASRRGAVEELLIRNYTDTRQLSDAAALRRAF